MKRVFLHAPWVALLLFPLLEVGAHAVTVARVPSERDWADAARFVRSELRDKDLITSAPAWTDPLLRHALGDRIDLAMAGRSDDAAYERAWSLSIRGARAPELVGRKLELSRSFGRVTVERVSLGKSPVLYDFARNVQSAEVSTGPLDRKRICRFGRNPEPRGGGLGHGALPPRQRFSCERGAWVAAVVQEDLDIRPHHCVRQPPVPGGPIRVQLQGVPLGEQLVFYGGLYYEDERMRQGAPVEVRVRVNERELLHMVHRDGDGWKRMQAATGGGTGDVTVEVTSRDPRKRGFCWAATTRSGGGR